MPDITIGPGPRNARTDPESGLRFYSWQGRDLPSVTSIRRMAGLPFGLHNWAIGKVIDHAIGDFGFWEERIRAGSEIDAELTLIRHELRKAATAERDAAAALGTAVHDAAASGRTVDEVPEELRPRLAQYLDWLSVSGVEIIASEFQVFNLAVGYAGTVDLLCRMRDGSIYLVDLKTGKGIYSDHDLQVAAYAMAEFVGADDVVDEALTPLLQQISGIAVLHLADDGWEFLRLKPPADNGAWRAFRGLHAFAMWSAENTSADAFTLAKRTGRHVHDCNTGPGSDQCVCGLFYSEAVDEATRVANAALASSLSDPADEEFGLRVPVDPEAVAEATVSPEVAPGPDLVPVEAIAAPTADYRAEAQTIFAGLAVDTRLSSDELKVMVRAAGISSQFLLAQARRMYPGTRDMRALDDDQRGKLYDQAATEWEARSHVNA